MQGPYNSARKGFPFFLGKAMATSNTTRRMPFCVQSMAVLTDGKFSTVAFRLEDDILLPNAAFTHTSLVREINKILNFQR